MLRRLSGTALAAGLACLWGCETGDPAFPPSGTLRLDVADLTLASQIDDVPANQFVKWSLSAATVEVAGAAPASLIVGPTPCAAVQRGPSGGSTCLTGIVLEPGSAGTATLRLTITELEVIRAEREELTATGDIDDDDVLDLEDNCPYVDNEDQANENAEDEGDDPVGDACSINEDAKDTDADGVADILDNCVYVPNADQLSALRLDGFVDGVGDACEQRVLVTLPSGGLVIERAGQPFTIRDQGITVLQLDFKSKVLLECNTDFTLCTIPDPSLVTLTVR